MGLHRQHRRVGADLRRRRARHRLPAGRAADARLLRRRSAPANNLFGESLVAVDLQTGERKWHFQLVHHGIWDMDIPCAPILADITVNGRTIKAVAQPTKQAFLYVFDRVTGQPVWPIEERPVPQGDAPGEWYSPTQPFPTRPPAYDRQGFVDRRPDRLHAGAARRRPKRLIERTSIGPIFTPPVVSRAEGPIATLAMGAQAAATNWPGGSFDPETGMLYVASQSAVGHARPRAAAAGHGRRALSPGHRADGRAAHRAARARPRRGAAAPSRALTRAGSAAGQAAVRPHQRHRPERGEIRWQVPHGETPDNDPQSSGAQGTEHSAHRAAGQRRHAGDEDAGDRRRSGIRADAVGHARRDAARLRQGDRRGSRRGATCRRRRPARR